MAYNSDGYIMIDFTEVDFRRTNQTIDGLFKRCVDVIGTNKFILVINANGRTPLPATCSFTNNQYVIDTCIYMFAVSSNDNLFIRRNDVPASDIIDDSSISVDKTWSSNKIDSELDTKADASALADYQPVLTPVSPISISEDDELSVDLSDYQPLLTAGDNISIVNDVISAKGIKSFTYTGTGSLERTITFPEIPTLFAIFSARGRSLICAWGVTRYPSIERGASYGQTAWTQVSEFTYDDTNKQLTMKGTSEIYNLNVIGGEFFVYYI